MKNLPQTQPHNLPKLQKDSDIMEASPFEPVKDQMVENISPQKQLIDTSCRTSIVYDSIDKADDPQQELIRLSVIGNDCNIDQK